MPRVGGRMAVALALTAAWLWSPGPANAGAVGFASLNRPLSVRQAGSGGLSLFANDALAARANPALLLSLPSPVAYGAGGASLLGGDQTTYDVGVGAKLDKNLAFGGSLAGMSESFDMGFGWSSMSLDHSLYTGEASVATGFLSNMGPVAKYLIFFPSLLFKEADLGATVREASDKISVRIGGASFSDTVSMTALDLGFVGRNPIPAQGENGKPSEIIVAAAIRNIGPDVSGIATPTQFRAGAGYRMEGGLGVGVEFVSVMDQNSRIILGGEYQAGDTFVLRAGLGMGDAVASTEINLGFTYVMGTMALDYAYSSHADLGGSHRFSLTFAAKAEPGEWDEISDGDLMRLIEESTYSRNSAKRKKAPRHAAADLQDTPIGPPAPAPEPAPASKPAPAPIPAPALTPVPASSTVSAVPPAPVAAAAPVSATVSAVPPASVAAPAPVSATAMAENMAAAKKLFEGKNYAAAMAKAEAMVKVDPGSWRAWGFLGNCRLKMLDKGGAREAYKKSLAINPDNPTLQDFLPMLESVE